MARSSIFIVNYQLGMNLLSKLSNILLIVTLVKKQIKNQQKEILWKWTLECSMNTQHKNG